MLKTITFQRLKPLIPTLIIFGVLSLSILSSTTANAATCDNNDTIVLECGNDTNGVWAILLIIISVMSAGVGVLGVAGIIYASILWTTAEDNEGQVTKAKDMIANVVIGLLAFALMWAGLNFLVPGGVFNRTFGFSKITNTFDDTLHVTDSDGTAASQSNGRTFKPSEVLMIGDSITAMAATGQNPDNKGWWQYLLDGKAGKFKFSAQNGSGYITKGDFSSGTTFYNRIDDISSKKPKAVVIAGGINDAGKSTAASGIEKYYTKLKSVLSDNHIKSENVYVLVPRVKGRADDIVPIVKSNAARVGVTFVNVGTYTETFDGLHPTSTSAKKIFDGFTSSDFDEKLISQDATAESTGGTGTTTDIKSVANLRDSAVSSGKLSSGTLYRSAQLSKLTTLGAQQMSSLLGSNATIIDLRTAAQRSAAPDKAIAGAKSISIPIEGILDTTPMVTDPTRSAQLAKALRAAANASGTVLVHCVAGKDRTGWMVAMIMYANGATDKQVMAEYMLSNSAGVGTVKPEWLSNGVQAARNQHGSVVNYLKSIGLSASDLSKLKTKFGA